MIGEVWKHFNILVIRNSMEHKGPKQIYICTLNLREALPKNPLLFLRQAANLALPGGLCFWMLNMTRI